MSGTKYCNASLDAERQAEQERQRQREAALEQQRREAEAEQRRQEALQKAIAGLKQDWQTALATLEPESVLLEDYSQLEEQGQKQQKELEQVTQQSKLVAYRQTLTTWQQQYQLAQATKRRIEAEQAHQVERERQLFELAELQGQVKALGQADAQKFAAHLAPQVSVHLTAVETALAEDADTTQSLLETAIAAVKELTITVNEARQQWQTARDTAQVALTELEALKAGMAADETVLRWRSQLMSDLQQLQLKAQTALSQEDFATVSELCAQAQVLANTAIEQANTMQLKANKRDYITNCMAQQLEAMGFTIVHRQPEYPHHPASATILSGETLAGKRVNVSIPVEGEVLYDVDGYEKRTVATVEGGTAKTCEEAHGMLQEFHQSLDEHYGVQMGEVKWDKKVPLDQLAERQQLPRSHAQARQNYRS